jgi:hypothetical protein
VPISVPDFAVQLATCLDPIERLWLQTELERSFRRVFTEAGMSSDPDVRGECLDNIEHVAVWQGQPNTDWLDEARDEGRRRLSLMAEAETFGCLVNRAFIERLIHHQWDSTPKVWNSSATEAAPDGPLHLTGLTMRFLAPDRVETRVAGYHEDPWPDVDFELVVTDTLGNSGGTLQCRSSGQIILDKSWLHYLQIGLAYVFWIFIEPIYLIAKGEAFGIPGAPSPQYPAGAGAVGAAFMPADDMLIPRLDPADEAQKIAFTYERVEVTYGGLFGGGQYAVVGREPSVRITGNRSHAVQPEDDFMTAWFGIVSDDLRGSIQVVWTADGVVSNPTSSQTLIRFDCRGSTNGSVLTRHVSVVAVDEDDVTARADAVIQIFVRDLHDESLDIICRAKPWLAQCSGYFSDVDHG